MFVRVSNFLPRNYCTNIWKNIFVISNVRFHHEGGLSLSRYFELFFSAGYWNPITQKISFSWGPLLASPNVWHNICKFWFLNICCNFSGQKSGSQHCQRLLNFDKYIFFSQRNKTLLLNIFWLKNALMASLTYSALLLVHTRTIQLFFISIFRFTSNEKWKLIR